MRPAGEARQGTVPGQAQGARPRSFLRELLWRFAVIAAFLLVSAAVGWLPAPWSDDEPGDPGPNVPEIPRDEADELAALRRRLELEPHSVGEAAGLLRAFRARADDPTLRDLAYSWEETLSRLAREPAEYHVAWKRFEVDRDAYRATFQARLEPGRPDIYLRVHRIRGGRDEVVFDSSDRPVEAWSAEWRGDERRRFTLEWARGDVLRVELCEKDIFSDDPIASWELGGDLSILLVSSYQRDAAGHAIDLESEAGLGN